MLTYPQLTQPAIRRDNLIPTAIGRQDRFQLIMEVQEWL